MLAGVTTDEIYINDPADGTVKAYSTAKSSSKGAYQLVYCIILKNDKSSLMSEGGGSVGGDSGGAAEVTSADEQAAQNLGIPMAALKGAYSESQLSSIFTLNEVPLEIADASSLSINEHYNLHNWRDTIYSSMEDTLLVRLMRRFVSFLGIMFTVWMIFLYLAYWFDRVNVFFEFSLLLMLSGDKLCLSDSEEKCTWQLKDLIKSKNKGAKSVNHRAMLQIVILGTLFGGIITSGVLFKAIRIFIVFILNVLKMWG